MRSDLTTESFQGLVRSGHKEAAVEVPFDPVVRWGASMQAIRPGRRGVAVRAALGRTAFDTFVVARSRRFWLLLDDAQLGASGHAVGDTVAVTLSPSA